MARADHFLHRTGLGKELVTVHPLGGSSMSRDGTGIGGVTNHIGQVFAGDGTKVHDGLICSDGSVVPTSLGAYYSLHD